MKHRPASELDTYTARLRLAVQDLERRVDSRLRSLGDPRRTSDPVYQRLWSALTRARHELVATQDKGTFENGARRAGANVPSSRIRVRGETV